MSDCEEDLFQTNLNTRPPEQDNVGHSIQIDQLQQVTREILEYHVASVVPFVGGVSYHCI